MLSLEIVQAGVFGIIGLLVGSFLKCRDLPLA